MCRDQELAKTDLVTFSGLFDQFFLDLHEEMDRSYKSKETVICKIYSKEKPQNFEMSSQEYHDKTL